jgi:hypothetical protein
MTMPLAEVRGGIAISGIFDLEPIRLNYLNEKLRNPTEGTGMGASRSPRALTPQHTRVVLRVVKGDAVN